MHGHVGHPSHEGAHPATQRRVHGDLGCTWRLAPPPWWLPHKVGDQLAAFQPDDHPQALVDKVLHQRVVVGPASRTPSAPTSRFFRGKTEELQCVSRELLHGRPNSRCGCRRQLHASGSGGEGVASLHSGSSVPVGILVELPPRAPSSPASWPSPLHTPARSARRVEGVFPRSEGSAYQAAA